MKVALDLDDCILDFTGGLRASIQKEYGVEIEPFEEWDLHPVLDPIIGGSFWQWLRGRDWLWKTWPAIDGAIGTIAQLRRDGHYLEIVTAKPDWARASVWQWLGRWRPDVDRVTIVGTHDEKYTQTDAGVLVDDKPEHVAAFMHDRRAGILFDRSHNQHARLPRAYSWADVREMVNRLEAGHVL
jgi:5' nucleotidase, deoxy (Pyrimidine), cytosolic type C protein (NT5C)